MLLGKDSLNKMKIGDATAVFWAERKSGSTEYDLERNFSAFFAAPPKDDPDQGVLAVRALYEAAHSGTIPIDEGNRFYVLGLAPNAARIAVRGGKGQQANAGEPGGSLVPERVDRIEQGGFAGGIKAEEHADGGAEGEGDDD